MNESLRIKVKELTSFILDDAHPVGTLREPVRELGKVFMDLAKLEADYRQDLSKGESDTADGLAVSPAMAVMCVEDFARTTVFLRGLDRAIRKVENSRQGGPVRVLYAGCGPFATLAVPLMSLRDAQRVQFTLLEIHGEALACARQVIAGLGFESYVSDFWEGNALSYQVDSSCAPDIILSETMQACLQAESQVAIFRHFYQQAPAALFVPEKIAVELKYVDFSRELSEAGKPQKRDRVEVGQAFVLSRETMAQWAGNEGLALPGEVLSIPSEEVRGKAPFLFTRVEVFEGHVLSDYDSGLSSPRALDVSGDLSVPGTRLQFDYQLGQSPGLSCTLIAPDPGPDYAGVYQELKNLGQEAWVEELRLRVAKQYGGDGHGDLPRWMAALADLEGCQGLGFEIVEGALRFQVASEQQLESSLRKLSPWRKGPFYFGKVFVDTEWRSDWKWERLKDQITPVAGRRILDVGCGNGYHLWRMLDEGARLALGIDPSLLFGCQFLAARHFAGEELPIAVLPLGIEGVPKNLGCFDTTFSMGVLYHRRSPIEHLEALRETLRAEGELVLETLVVEGGENTVLIPKGRYAQMRNVWFLPSVELLVRMMERVGFREVTVLDVTRTTVEEQRSTEWMTFNSLPDFLNPSDSSKTVEGYPAPLRAVLRGRR